MITIQDILPKLQGVKGRGPQYTARCPAHGDKTNSLSVADTGSRVLLHCHAGCTFEAIISALGISKVPKRNPVRVESAPMKPEAKIDPEVLGLRWAKWALSTTDDKLQELATELGVSLLSLRQVGCCWAWPHTSWGFPMHNASGQIVGMRLRSLDGSKYAISGSREGLFMGEMVAEPFCIVEGPSDLAALITMGFSGLGRPNCKGAVNDTVEYCRMAKISPVIISDDDGPGMAGAIELQAIIKGSKLLKLSHKDTREYLLAGGTHNTLLSSLRAL